MYLGGHVTEWETVMAISLGHLRTIFTTSLLAFLYATTSPQVAFAVEGQSVVSFSLINADTDQPISGFDPLTPGATLNFATLPTSNLNIRANTSPSTVGSVRFGLDGNANYRTETAAPYSLGGDVSGIEECKQAGRENGP